MQIHVTGYILKKQPYKDSGWILTLLTMEHGKVDVLLRSAKGFTVIDLELFNQCQFTLSEIVSSQTPWMRPELSVTPLLVIKDISIIQMCHLKNEPLWLGLYLNELLCEIMPKNVPDKTILDTYSSTLNVLKTIDTLIPEVEFVLRIFEMRLLDFMGVLPDFTHDEQGRKLVDQDYYLSVDQGIVSNLEYLKNQDVGTYDVYIVLSYSFLQMFSDYDQFMIDKNIKELKYLKRVTRFLMHPLLKGKVLKSRELFTSSK